MKNILEFLAKAGKVKNLKQRGLVLRGVKDPATVGSHSFREAIMGWVLASAGEEGLDSSRVIKITLVHDLCAGHAGDLTPYEPILKKVGNEKDLKKVFLKWIRLPKKEKEKFYAAQRKKERASLAHLTIHLPKEVASEMNALWAEFENGLTREGRFVQQIDMLENFLQAIEYWKDDASFPIESWWQQMKELISDPTLVAFLQTLDKKLTKKEGV